jgi:diguanylate cyclase (GGDEF)-like protein
MNDRLAELHAAGSLATSDDYPVDYITHIGTRLFDVPVCMLSVIDAHRQWIKSSVGLDITQSPRGTSFCGYALATDRSLVVEDTVRDLRFADDPIVTGPPHVRFYAGHPVRNETGTALGTLCLLDVKPREFRGRQLGLLAELSVVAQLALKTRQTSAAQSLLGVKSDVARRESMLDPLLRIWNRGGIGAILEQLSPRCRGQRAPLSLLMIDVDRFRRINDGYGRRVGDGVLKAIARELRSVLRSSDDIGRHEGEKFLAVLPNARGVAAERMARRMKEAIALLRIQVPSAAHGRRVSIGCTVSIGVAEWSWAPGDTPRTLIDRAEMALRVAKGLGRNRVCCGDGGAPAGRVGL